jgi:uncharacterized protein YidB (DUF937 family)
VTGITGRPNTAPLCVKNKPINQAFILLELVRAKPQPKAQMQRRPNEEASMSLFDTIGSLLGKGDGTTTSVPEALVTALGSQEGGLGGLIQKFQAAGLGSTISSWIGAGENQAVAPDALHGVLGSDLVQQIAAKTGLPVDQLLPQIAQHLPGLIDSITPNGEVPSGENLLNAGLAYLKSRMA